MLATSPQTPGKPRRAFVDAAFALDEIPQRLTKVLVFCRVALYARPFAPRAIIDVNIYKAEEATIGTSFLFFFWAAGCLILGLLTLLSRGSKIVVEEWKEPLNEVPIGARYGPPISRAKETKLIIFLIALGISAVVIFSLWKVSEYFGLFFFLRAITEHYKENKPLEEHNTARTRRSPDQAWEGRFSDALRSQQAWLAATSFPASGRLLAAHDEVANNIEDRMTAGWSLLHSSSRE